MTDDDRQRGREARSSSQRLRAVALAHLERMRRDQSSFPATNLARFGIARLYGVQHRVRAVGEGFPWDVVHERGISSANER